jgi:hypothetical protein
VIVVDLICSAEHRFEGWFASHDAFDAQSANGSLSCPVCGAQEVRRLPSAPHVARSASQPSAPVTPKGDAPNPGQVLQQLINALRDRASQSEDVGERFANEARKIHYGDAEERAIKGVATMRDTLELIEEGISVLPVPPPKEDLH